MRSNSSMMRTLLVLGLSVVAMVAGGCSSHSGHSAGPSNTIGTDQSLMLAASDFPNGYRAEPINDPYYGWQTKLKDENGTTADPAECHSVLLDSIKRALKVPRAGIIFTYQGDSKSMKYSETIIHDQNTVKQQTADDRRCGDATGHYPDGDTTTSNLATLPPPVGLPKVPSYLTHSIVTNTFPPGSGKNSVVWQYDEGYAQIGSITLHLELSNFGNASLNQDQFNDLFVKAVNKAQQGSPA